MLAISTAHSFNAPSAKKPSRAVNGSPASGTVNGWSPSAARSARRRLRQMRTLTFAALKHWRGCILQKGYLKTQRLSSPRGPVHEMRPARPHARLSPTQQIKYEQFIRTNRLLLDGNRPGPGDADLQWRVGHARWRYHSFCR